MYGLGTFPPSNRTGCAMRKKPLVDFWFEFFFTWDLNFFGYLFLIILIDYWVST